MSVIRGLVDRLAPPRRAPDPLEGYSERERLALIQGRGLPNAGRRSVRVTAASPLRQGEQGPSIEAAELFNHATGDGADGRLSLWLMARSGRARLRDLRELAEELAAFDLVTVQDDVLTVAPEFARVMLVSGWRRWDDGSQRVIRTVG